MICWLSHHPIRCCCCSRLSADFLEVLESRFSNTRQLEELLKFRHRLDNGILYICHGRVHLLESCVRLFQELGYMSKVAHVTTATGHDCETEAPCLSPSALLVSRSPDLGSSGADSMTANVTMCDRAELALDCFAVRLATVQDT